MIAINDFDGMVAELEGAFREIQQPRSPFVLQHFVLGAHDTEPRQYAQCVLELQIKYDAIRRANVAQGTAAIRNSRAGQWHRDRARSGRPEAHKTLRSKIGPC